MKVVFEIETTSEIFLACFGQISSNHPLRANEQE